MADKQFFGHIIDNEESEAISNERYDVWNPWTREVWAEAARGNEEDTNRAVASARKAFDTGPWPRMARAERAQWMHKLADALESRSEEFARLDSRNMAKPLEQSRGDVSRSAHNLRFFADHQRDAAGAVYPMDSGHHAYDEYGPVGVVAAISPWNFPLMQGTWKLAPAIAWGNTCVIKPSEDTPASVTALGRLAAEIGFPPGVINVVNGLGAEAGAALTANWDVDRITFTGSSTTGKHVMASAATHLAPVSLELGGKGANIVFDDADIDNAVYWTVEAIFRNAGQICLSGSRLFVQDAIYDEFMEKFIAAAENLTIGDPMNPETKLSALSSRHHFEKVASYVEQINELGGRIHTGGVAHDGSWVVRPTIADGLALDSAPYREEIFGPVCIVNRFSTEDEAVRLANDTRYGLNAMLFSEKLSRAHRVASRLRAGMVWVNCFYVRDLRTPFGGVGDSGIGREGGDFSRAFFTDPKSVVMQIKRDA